MPEAVVALAAAPNTGKSTLFNRLTGANQKVGNWPGATVTRKTGSLRLGEWQVELVDLPGAYSMSPTSEEERVVQDFLLHSPPDLIVNVLDAGNLYRGLGLTLQIAMSGLPMVVALNMMDEARARGIEIDHQRLAEHLGAPVVPIVARTGEGLERLRQVMRESLQSRRRSHPPHISFPPVMEEAIAGLARKVERRCGELPLEETFVAMRLMEGGDAAAALTRRCPSLGELVPEAVERRIRAEHVLHEDMATTCAQCRFNAARGLIQETVRHPPRLSDDLSERVDRLALHPLLGLPLFFLVMWALFQGVFALGTPVQEWLGAGIEAVQEGLRAQPWLGALPDWVGSLLVDGLIGGVGVVLSFLPVIVLFFMLLSLIEDTGYIARAAFLMDRAMHFLRLDGKAFISLLLGYGCNVPAVMGTRILSSRHNRILAMLLVPFTLCSARLQVFLFFTAILFPPTVAPWVLFGLYVLSFAVIFLGGLILRPFHFGPPEPFIMELPPYRLPLLRTVVLRAWQEVRAFLYRAGTMIVSGVVLVWFLTHVPASVPPGSPETLAGRIGGLLAPVFEPIGIRWAETVALIFGFVAKEIVIGALAVIYAGGDLAAQIGRSLTPLEGLSFMVFTLIYTPCVATVATIRTESGSWRITALSVGLGLALAWVTAWLVYHGGLWLGFS